ncbi:MAG: methionyl-tRNA formyltransferase [Ilumatobacteraceae bacterium]
MAPLRALVDAGYDVAAVVTRVDKRRGRGGATQPSPVKAAAAEFGIPVLHRVDELLALDPPVELGVVVAFGQLIKPHVLERVAMVNIHFSLLPRWRGAAPVERALLAGDAVTGTCLMQLEVGLDTGAVYDRVEVPIAERMTAVELREALVAAGTEQLLRVLDRGLVDPVPQDGEATYAAKIDPSELRIDWSRPTAELDRLVRLGGAWTMFRDRRIKLLDAAPGPAVGEQAGVLGAGPTPTVATIDGSLTMVRVQPEGKAPMDAAAWWNGARPAGERLT